MKHFVFLANNSESTAWKLVLKAVTLKEVRDHMNNKSIYPNPTAWVFMVIKGRELPVDFQAVVKF